MKTTTNRSCTAFKTWHTTSAVRSRPYAYHFSVEDFTQSEPDLWFPSALSPALAHDLTKQLPKKDQLILHAYHLVHFMDYTTQLEMCHINAAVQCIVTGELKKYFDETIYLNALKLYADEAYHALFSREVADQVANHFCLERINSARLKRLDQALQISPPALSSITRFCIAFVSETLITYELYSLTRDSLVAPVAHMLIDHLHDEGRHAIFFSDCFARLWQQLCIPQRDYLVATLLKTLKAFCQPDEHFLGSIFKNHPSVGKRIIDNMNENWTTRMPTASKMTLRAIMRTDLLEEERYALQFRSAGLIA
ncbi:hypothetical protein B8W72_08965 [Pseudomonas putida]|uniref:Aminobenzoate oxygenase n=1 Tax=Pseudomonas putida TaxID=303 RepID=A0A1Y3LFG1_PSEPU|nr:diiron oxygenase [Pseudomonas putida]OUM35361.1 hypothetical protein B8W72_08965 [Pseudomonas putida]